MTRDEKIAALLDGRFKVESQEELDACRELAKVLRTADHLDYGFRSALADLFDPKGHSDRRITFVHRRPGNRPDAAEEKEIAEFIRAKTLKGVPDKAAIEDAEKKFTLKRSRLRDIWKTWKPILNRLHRVRAGK